MKASDKLKQKLIYRVTGERLEPPEDIATYFETVSGSEWSDEMQDAKSDLRGGTDETGLDCESSRHYESKAVAAQMLDGSWVGWTYWYGGGKHAEPESIEWIDDAYDVTMTEVQKVVREFAKV